LIRIQKVHHEQPGAKLVLHHLCVNSSKQVLSLLCDSQAVPSVERFLLYHELLIQIGSSTVS